MHYLDPIFLALTILLVIPVAVVCVQCLASLLPPRRHRGAARNGHEREPLVVLIPAHDEEACLSRTLQSVKRQLRQGDRILVVADNCHDRTAQIALDGGAEVVSRFNPELRGKGYALNYGIEHLLKLELKPSVTIVIDADCVAEPGAIDALAAQTVATGRPAQAIYLLDQPEGSPNSHSILSGLAFLVRNGVRPRGSDRLGFPCQLTGSGMSFPWEAISTAELGSGSLVEDMQLGLDLVIKGWPASLCEEARITGRLPVDVHAAKTQRTRWEHGQIVTALTQIPRLLAAGIRKGKLAPLAVALDLCVPPLSLLALLIIGMLIATAALAVCEDGSWYPTVILIYGALALLACLTIACSKFGRASLPMASLLAMPGYILWKLPIYIGLIGHRQKEWIRTPRTQTPEAEAIRAAPPPVSSKSPEQTVTVKPVARTSLQATHSSQHLVI